jgi:hypothetical protein
VPTGWRRFRDSNSIGQMRCSATPYSRNLLLTQRMSQQVSTQVLFTLTFTVI